MRIRNLKVTIIVGMLIIALVPLGIAYGLWSQTLTLEGIVETGEVDAKWIWPYGCFEFYPWPEGGNFGEYEGKDVGSWGFEMIDTHTLRFTIDNAYPSYAVDCSVKYQIAGTIPVYVRGARIVPGPELSNCELTDMGQTVLLECDELTVKFTDGIGLQLHPGDEQGSNFVVHVEQPAEELSTYTFDIVLCVAQWNEYATADQCFAAAP